MTPIHKRIIEQIAQYVMNCDPQGVEDFILDSAKQIELINDFTKKGNQFLHCIPKVVKISYPLVTPKSWTRIMFQKLSKH